MSTTINWHFAVQKRNGNAYLHHLTLSPHDNGPTALSKLQAAYTDVVKKAPYKLWDKPGMFWDPVVEVARLSEYSGIDTEAQVSPQRVIILESSPDVELTSSFRDPELLSTAENFVRRNERFADGKVIMYIRQKLNFCGLCVLVFTGAFLCVGVGTVVGIWSDKMALGVAATSGLATVAACVEAFRFWAYK